MPIKKGSIKSSKPTRVCGDCIHLYACIAWNLGSLRDANAMHCINFQKSEIKHAHWMDENTRPKSAQFMCSECGQTAYFPQNNRVPESGRYCGYRYCPMCGAKMDEVGNEV